MSLAALERLLTDSIPISAPAQRRAIAAALAALDPAPVLERVTAQAAGDYAGWPIARWPHAQLSVFALGPRTSIPLHDHPEMHVFTRTLTGRAEAVVYDWLEPEALVATRRVETQFTPEAPVWLTEPLRGNLHALETREPCVFLDLFAPYYDAQAGRRCSYYEVAASEGDQVRLRTLPLARPSP